MAAITDGVIQLLNQTSTNRSSDPTTSLSNDQDHFGPYFIRNASGEVEIVDNHPNMARPSSEGESSGPANPTPSSESEKAEEPAIAPGMLCGYKNLYSGPEDKHGRYTWLEEPPEDVRDPAENKDSAKFALIVRNERVYNDPRRTLKIHSIVVQSAPLKTLLGTVLEGYPGVTTNLQRLTFSGRFEPLIHRWAELNEAIAKEADATTKEHAELLQGVLEKEFKTDIEESQDYMANGVIAFELLWTLFHPDSIVYGRQDGQERAYKFLHGTYTKTREGEPLYQLTTQFVEWDGTRFGTSKAYHFISVFNGTRKITTLETLPMSFHPKAKELQKRLIERGVQVEKLGGPHYKAYNGIGWRKERGRERETYSIKGRIMIDTAMWNRFNPNQGVLVNAFTRADAEEVFSPTSGRERRRLSSSGEDDDDERSNAIESEEQSDEEEVGVSYSCSGLPLDSFFPEYDEDTAKTPPLTTTQKLICTPLLRGYSLTKKMWLNFFVNCVHEIKWNEGAFESLVLPESQKELVLGFTESQRKFKKSFDDVIEGKGKGVIILLCGPPGVGKTLTAESVAEEMKVPLYMMSAGDLDLNPRTMEEKLSSIMEMCIKWNAILLLDEADVFLEQRSLHELQRNELVSIFLRILEYYEGIMFLTTNRVQTFDPAFQSRIHISLDYPELSSESRLKVWNNFLTAAKAGGFGNSLSPTQLDRLAGMQLNGRQIKNVLKTSQLLAGRRDEELAFKHINNVLDSMQHLHTVTRESDQQRSALYG